MGPDVQRETILALGVVELVHEIGIDASVLPSCVGIGKVAGLCLRAVVSLRACGRSAREPTRIPSL